MIKIANEVILPRRVRPQPQPHLHPGGDCGYCVLAGIMDCTVEDAYRRVNHDPKTQATSWYEIRSHLHALESIYLDRIIVATPMWPHEVMEARTQYGFSGPAMSLAWFDYVRMALDAGYYGLTAVDHSKEGGEVDHFVLLCGVRSVTRPHPRVQGAGIIDNEVLVSCSSTTTPDEEWVEVNAFLSQRGGYNVLLARPK